MTFNPDIHNRRSIRLKHYDYTQPGGYYITMVIQDRTCILGEITNGEMILSESGKIVQSEWMHTPEIRPNIRLDMYVIMPNHIHGIIVITGRGTKHRAPTPTMKQNTAQYESFGKPVSNSIPTIVRSFKAIATKQINQLRNTPGLAVWQRNYYEHIIRDDNELNHIREYIQNNPLRWEFDSENPYSIL